MELFEKNGYAPGQVDGPLDVRQLRLVKTWLPGNPQPLSRDSFFPPRQGGSPLLSSDAARQARPRLGNSTAEERYNRNIRKYAKLPDWHRGEYRNTFTAPNSRVACAAPMAYRACMQAKARMQRQYADNLYMIRLLPIPLNFIEKRTRAIITFHVGKMSHLFSVWLFRPLTP